MLFTTVLLMNYLHQGGNSLFVVVCLFVSKITQSAGHIVLKILQYICILTGFKFVCFFGENLSAVISKIFIFNFNLDQLKYIDRKKQES